MIVEREIVEILRKEIPSLDRVLSRLERHSIRLTQEQKSTSSHSEWEKWSKYTGISAEAKLPVNRVGMYTDFD